MGDLQMKLLPMKQEYEYPRCRRYTAFPQAHSNAAREGTGNKKQGGGADSVKKIIDLASGQNWGNTILS